MSENSIKKELQGVGVWEHFTVEDGLPDMKIEALFVDSKGYLWIGTHDRGAARFDGDRFETFTRKDGLAGDGVFSIIEDRERALWFGTVRGLTRYTNGVFQEIRLYSGKQERFLWGGSMDRNGILWFGMAGPDPVVCRWDGKSFDLIPMTVGIGPEINRTVVDARGNIWLGKDDGVYCYDGETFHFIVGPSGPFGGTRILLPRSNGSLWIANHRKGLYVYDDGRFEQLGEEFTADHAISELLEDSTGRVWLTTSDGQLLCYEGGSFRLIQNMNIPFYGGLCLDKKGRLWIGTYRMGLYCYDTTRFEVFQKSQGLPANRVYCIVEDAKGLLWIGTEDGIVRYDNVTFRPLEGIRPLTDRQVSALLPDHNGHLWIGSGGNLYRYDGEVLHLEFKGSTRWFARFAEDRAGRIWCAFHLGGIGYYENGRYHPFLHENDVSYPGYVGGLVVDRQGIVWVGSGYPSHCEGLYRYDEEHFTAFTQTDGLAGGAICSLYEDRHGILWIGASGGVSCYDGTHFTTFTREDGLPHEIVTAIAQTEDGTFWFGTEGGGVCRYDGQVFQVITIPGDSGLNVISAIHQDSQHQVWFGTMKGLVRYIPHRERPEVAITGVIADQTYEATQDIEIPTTVHRISCSFRGRSFIERSSQLVYRYRLEGYEEEWHQTRERQVDYPQLTPGEYRFMVQAVDSDLNYSEMTSVRLAVIPDPHITGLTEALRVKGTLGEFIGSSLPLRRLLKQIQEVAQTNLTVLILGETGTGKGLTARAIHSLSDRQEGPFITVNCGAIPEGLAESELFGHEKGAFTGAISRKLGRFELAERGTLFLDEIGDLALSAQVKLLRFLEDRVFERVGGEKELRADVRVLAATNRDLEKMVSEGQFREDLYFRLRTFPIRVPTLRERLEDISVLAGYFAERFSEHLNFSVPGIEPAALERLRDYTWPGNVRELEHLIQRVILLHKGGTISADDISGVLLEEQRPSEDNDFIPLDEYERRYLERVLEAVNWVVFGPKGAAHRLGIHPEKLRVKMKKYGLHRPQ